MATSLLHVCGIFLFIVMNSSSIRAVNFCTNHNFIDSRRSHFMQFTKETINQEYAVDGQFKSLHCCAKGYRSIEWWVYEMSIQWISSRLVTCYLHAIPNKTATQSSSAWWNPAHDSKSFREIIVEKGNFLTKRIYCWLIASKKLLINFPCFCGLYKYNSRQLLCSTLANI